MIARSFEVSLAKAEYLLTYRSANGKGGDKRRFWRDIMGFQSPILRRSALLEATVGSDFEPDGQNAYGNLYRMVVKITGPSGREIGIRTVWIVRFEDDIAS